jgi:hypothetical protein
MPVESATPLHCATVAKRRGPRWPRRAAAAALLGPLLGPLLTGCELLGEPSPGAHAPVPAPVAVAPAPAPQPEPPPLMEPKPDLAEPADQVARRLLAYHERLLQMTPAELAAEITRLDGEVAHTSSAGAPDVVLDQALALAQQHGPGDLARASGLLEAIVQAQSADMQPWQPMARLLAGPIAEQRRLEDLIEQQATQRRETQRAIQQLTEKLEALKAIERSMTTRSASAPRRPGPAAGNGAGAAESAPAAPRSP